MIRFFLILFFCVLFSPHVKAGFDTQDFIDQNTELFDLLSKYPSSRSYNFDESGLIDYQRKWANFFPWYQNPKNIPSNWMLDVDNQRCDSGKRPYDVLRLAAFNDIQFIADRFRAISEEIKKIESEGLFEEEAKKKRKELENQKRVSLSFLKLALENTLRFSDRIFRENLNLNNFFDLDNKLVDILLKEPSFRSGSLGKEIRDFFTYVPENDACEVYKPDRNLSKDSVPIKESCDISKDSDITQLMSDFINFNKQRRHFLKRKPQKEMQSAMLANIRDCGVVKISFLKNNNGEITGIDFNESYVLKSSDKIPFNEDQARKLFITAASMKNINESIAIARPIPKRENIGTR